MIAFTICSNNYLAQAKTLEESFLARNPSIPFFIGLVDEPLENAKHNIVSVSEIMEQTKFNQMSRMYDITELSTAVKPYYFDYFFNKGYQKVVYLDPDIIVFNTFNTIDHYLTQYSAIVTPHFCSPPNDEKRPSDFNILLGGVYNLGFAAFSKTEESISFINWWKQKLLTHCFQTGGMFTDQLWVNYLTCLCDKVLVIRDLGYNVANWNLHERIVGLKNNIYYINDKYPLIFFHFSNYNLDIPERLAVYNNRYILPDRPDVLPLFQQYKERLLFHGLNYYKTIQPKFGIPNRITRAVVLRAIKDSETPGSG